MDPRGQGYLGDSIARLSLERAAGVNDFRLSLTARFFKTLVSALTRLRFSALTAPLLDLERLGVPAATSLDRDSLVTILCRSLVDYYSCHTPVHSQLSRNDEQTR
jgi:hypothetical protein